ncbi:MAG: methylenetetrahydrofolate reductase [Pseudomonadota bacterium]
MSTQKPRIPASIEASPKLVLDGKTPKGLFPKGTSVYVTDIGTHTTSDMIAACRSLTDAGYSPVPHLPARRIMSEIDLTRRIAGYTQEGGASDLLLIAGEADRQMGPYSQTLDILEQGILDHYGIKQFGIAGHPEGNPNYPIGSIDQVLFDKATVAARTNADARIVTQFGFDPQVFIRWAERVRIAGLYLPIHLGVAGPAKFTTLVKYAAMCGVGNSIGFLRKRTSAVTALATGYNPNQMIEPIEEYWADNPGGPITHIHMFPFGGIAKAAEWLEIRGNWDIKISLYANDDAPMLGAAE